MRDWIKECQDATRTRYQDGQGDDVDVFDIVESFLNNAKKYRYKPSTTYQRIFYAKELRRKNLQERTGWRVRNDLVSPTWVMIWGDPSTKTYHNLLEKMQVVGVHIEHRNLDDDLNLYLIPGWIRAIIHASILCDVLPPFAINDLGQFFTKDGINNDEGSD